MKHLCLVGLVSLLSLTSSYAQNTVRLSQNGTSLTATANQTGNLNISTISQTGGGTNSVLAIISQQGISQQANIQQNNGSTFNRAAITQVGTGAVFNGAVISQEFSGGSVARGNDRTTPVAANAGNWAGVWQLGSSNAGAILQDSENTKASFGETWQQGTSNRATLGQIGTNNGLAEIFQGNDTRPAYNDEGNTAIDVTGNEAVIDQFASVNNKAKIKQFSHGNTAAVNQIFVSTSNTAYVLQGDGVNLTTSGGNSAMITQNTVSSGNSASAIQTGQFGDVQIRQINDATGNTALVQQVTGVSSQAQVNQANGSTNNTAITTQWGNSHYASTEQRDNSVNNQATIQQGSAAITTSVNNEVIVTQQSSTGSIVSIRQNTTLTGGDNYASVRQGRAAVSTNNLARVQQEGSSNDARLIQYGTTATASIGQYGDFNVVTGSLGYALQDGTSTTMTVTQLSPVGTRATISNRASLDQVGAGHSIILNQTVTAGAVGGNSSVINQAGLNNSAVVSQINGVIP